MSLNNLGRKDVNGLESLLDILRSREDFEGKDCNSTATTLSFLK